MNNKYKFWQVITVLLLLMASAKAQTYIEYNAPTTITNGTVDEYNYIVIGPDAVLTIEQDWYVMTQNIYIHPDAIVNGPGTIHIMDPGVFGTNSSGPTTIDGGGAVIDAIVSIENANNVVLNGIDPVAVIPSLTWADAGTNDLVLGSSLNFGADGGDVIMNGSNVIFDADAAYTYTDLNTIDFPGTDTEPATLPSGSILVNNGAGNVVKQALAGSFTFPVGIAEGDYTPATISGAGAATDITVHVSDYTTSPSDEQAPTEGIDRTWNIFASTPVTATVALQHNLATNGAAYDNTQGFVTQYQGGGAWSTAPSDAGAAGDIAGSWVQTNATYSLPASAADNGAFFSKASDPLTPLPVHWLSFTARQEAGCSVDLAWRTAQEENSDYYLVERSYDGMTWTTVTRLAAAGNTTTETQYKATDAIASEGVVNYRIKQADRDGTLHYSTIQTLNLFCNGGVVKVYPTLNHSGIVYVSLPAGYEAAQLRLTNINGQLLQVPVSNNGLSRTLYLHSLPKGTYVLQVMNKKAIQNFKIVYLK